MQTGSSPQSHMNVHLLPVAQNHHRLCRDLAGHSNDPGLPLHCVCRSRSPPAGVFLPLTGYFLAQEWLASETELLPKVVCHEWWAYELTDDRNIRSTLFLPIQRCGQRFFFLSQKRFYYCLTLWKSFLNLVLWVVCQERGKLGTGFWRHTNFSWQGKPIWSQVSWNRVVHWVGLGSYILNPKP